MTSLSCSPSEDAVLDRGHHPKMAPSGFAEPTETNSSLLCAASSSALSHLSLGRSSASSGRRNAPVATKSRRAPEGTRLGDAVRPKPDDVTCLCPTLLQAAESRIGRSDQHTGLSTNASLERAVRRPLARPLPPSEDRDCGHRRVDQNKFRSALRRKPVSPQPSPARPKPRGSGAPERTGRLSRPVGHPEASDSGPTPRRSQMP